MTETVRYWGAIEVSKEDAAALDRDVLLYGNCWVQTFEKGLAKRIDPAKVLSSEVRIESSILPRYTT